MQDVLKQLITDNTIMVKEFNQELAKSAFLFAVFLVNFALFFYPHGNISGVNVFNTFYSITMYMLWFIAGANLIDWVMILEKGKESVIRTSSKEIGKSEEYVKSFYEVHGISLTNYQLVTRLKKKNVRIAFWVVTLLITHVAGFLA